MSEETGGEVLFSSFCLIFFNFFLRKNQISEKVFENRYRKPCVLEHILLHWKDMNHSPYLQCSVRYEVLLRNYAAGLYTKYEITGKKCELLVFTLTYLNNLSNNWGLSHFFMFGYILCPSDRVDNPASVFLVIKKKKQQSEIVSSSSIVIGEVLGNMAELLKYLCVRLCVCVHACMHVGGMLSCNQRYQKPSF